MTRPSDAHATRHTQYVFGLGLLLLAPYLAAWYLGDLRANTEAFLVTFFVAFGLYTAVTVIALRMQGLSPRALIGAFALAAIMHGILVFTSPTLSDDMYRYVWNGRVQAEGISPYLYPPNAPELEHLRDDQIWLHINRKSAVTVYPPAAEMAYAILWRIWPDSVRWFQIAMAMGGLLAGALLVGLLRDLGRSPARVLIFLWAPLLVFETAHGAHVDGLVLPLLVGAWWARVRERDGLVGMLLAVATSMKFYPALLLPALWRPHHPRARWLFPLAFGATLVAFYIPYVISSGAQVIGFLPDYFGERFNMGLAGVIIPLFTRLGVDPNRGMLALLLIALAIIGLLMVLRPASDPALTPSRSGETAVRRSVWLIGAFTLLAQNLFSWYMLWLLPLIAIFLQPGRVLGLRANAWTGWWLFCGLIVLSYSFFISWRPAPLATWSQFIPLYVLLVVDLVRRSGNSYLLARPLQLLKHRHRGSLSDL